MRSPNTVAAVLLLLWPFAAGALELKGVSLGSSQADAMRNFDEFKCTGELGLEVCLALNQTIANAPAKTIAVSFDEQGRASAVLASFSSRDAERVIAALKARHGPAAFEGEETRAGRAYRTLRWEGEAGESLRLVVDAPAYGATQLVLEGSDSSGAWQRAKERKADKDQNDL